MHQRAKHILLTTFAKALGSERLARIAFDRGARTIGSARRTVAEGQRESRRKRDANNSSF